MYLAILGGRQKIRGEVVVPNSKYHAHRALILASLAPGISQIKGLSDARHVQYTVSLLRSLGIRVDMEGDTFIVHGGRYRPKTGSISAGSSGTTLYFMVGLAALAESDVVVTGQKYFQRRPIGPLLDALRQMGVDVESPTDCPPITVKAKKPTGGEVHIAGTLSQWISGLILLAPFATGNTTIVVDGTLNERTYIGLTIRMMKQFGLNVTVSDDWHRYEIEGGQQAHPTDLTMPPDIGSAAFGLAAAAIHPSDILLKGLYQTKAIDSDHPEADFLDIAAAMGLPMEFDEKAGGVRVVNPGMRLKSTEIDCRDIPDMLPILSTMASFADGVTTFKNVEHVRLKESDRVTSMLQLNGMGGHVEFDGHSLRVHGVDGLTAANLSSFNDHRVLMSLAVAASAAEGRSTLTYPNAYRISYPRFLESMNVLGLEMGTEQGQAPRRTVRRPSPTKGHTHPTHGVAADVEKIAGQTAPALVRAWAEQKPTEIAVVDADEAQTRRLTWGELDERADRIGSMLLSLGVKPGDRVALQLPNRLEFVSLSVAAMRIGATVCPIMPIFREREVGYALSRSKATIMVTAEEFRGRRHADELVAVLDREDLPLKHVLVLADGADPVARNSTAVGWHDWDETLAATEIDREAVDAYTVRPDDYAQLLFTSGTSGEPKGVLHKHSTLSRAASMEVRHLGLNAEDGVFIPSPLAHQTGFLYGMWLSFVLGSRQILMPKWDAVRALQVMRGWNAGFVQAATPFLTDLVKAVEAGTPAPETLRMFVVTGAAVPRALAERATRVLGAAVCGAFGTTETCLGALASPADEPVQVWGTDGRALEGVRLRIVDDEGRVLPDGAEGNYELKSETMFDGYLDRPDLTAEAFTADGWYRTGDLATIDENGFLRITGRVRDVINRGGEKIPVAEIEELLYRHPAVEDAALVAMPDERLGERACAFIVPAADAAPLDFAAMQAYLDAEQVSKHYWPERLEIIEEIPRNAVGKVQKFLLRERAATLTSQRGTDTSGKRK